MNTPQFIAHSRFSFALLRWSPLVALVVLPFTFSDGALQPKAFATAFLVAIAWLISLLRFWRSRNLFWVAAGWMALFFGSKWSCVNRADVSMSAFSQWLCVVIIFAGAPLLLFRLRLLRWAGLLV